MKSIIKYTFITSLLIGGTSACTNLDEEIKGDYTKDFVVANPGVGLGESGAKDGLEAPFAKLFSGTANHGSYFSIQEISSDEAVITQKGGDWFDGGIWLDMHKHNFGETSGGINGAWTDTYNGISDCNDLLAKPDQSAGNIAQLRMLRAYYYWRLLDLFGNVKLIVNPTVGANVAQSTRAQVFDFVEAELLASIPNLPTGKAKYGRCNQAGAYALLSRLYLNAGVYSGTNMYQEAIDAADEVINSGLYNISTPYADVFAPNNTDNPEHIFVVPFDESTGTGMNLAQMTLHYPSQLTYQLAEQPWNGYSTMEEFYNSYDAADKRKTANFIVGPQFDKNGNPVLDLAYDKGDPDGAPVNYTPFINQLFPNGSRQGGARLGKFSFKSAKQLQSMDNDFPLLRYGEVLLNKAEALGRLNGFNDATALGLVNQLRARAGVPDFATMTEGQMLAERGRELFIESLRRTDLIRFGAFGNAWWEKPAHSNPNLNLFAIPQQQINASQVGSFPLQQNPGY